MDSEAVTRAHLPQWQRLNELNRKRRLSGAEVDELITLYGHASADLSELTSAGADPDRIAGLSALLMRSHTRLSQPKTSFRQSLSRMFFSSLPAVLYQLRWWTLGVTLASVAVSLVVALWSTWYPQVLDMQMTPMDQRHYAQQAFEQYYSEHPHAGFAAMVWTHNSTLAIFCVAGGITGVLPAYLLLTNAINLGLAGAVMYRFSSLEVFFGLILPHGTLELCAVFVAAAAGLKICWTVAVPGQRTRVQALAQEGRALVLATLGVTIMLAISGIFEGFLTPSTLPVWLKLVIGIGTTVLMWVAIVLIGGRAYRAGARGDLDIIEAGYLPATSA